MRREGGGEATLSPPHWQEGRAPRRASSHPHGSGTETPSNLLAGHRLQPSCKLLVGYPMKDQDHPVLQWDAYGLHVHAGRLVVEIALFADSFRDRRAGETPPLPNQVSSGAWLFSGAARNVASPKRMPLGTRIWAVGHGRYRDHPPRVSTSSFWLWHGV